MLSYEKNENDFQLVCEIRSKARDIPIYKFKSLKTGLHIIIAKVEGPIVQGFFTIATEAHDDDGLPHTLEHLVFLGSEDYPYKGVLDLLANRCLAEGTNAWTDVDHTSYTVMTAGSDGFLNLLPIYLDHLLYPTITDAGFITEVYHITGQGNDAGVVYSEMQARENTGPELTYNKMMRVLYPEPSGYHYETGGMMKNLRESINSEKIRRYHKEMYRPENLHIIITGQVDPKDVFRTLQPLEDKIVSKGERGEFKRPWESPIPPFTKSEDLEIVYPSDSEDTGIFRIGWRGPSIVTNLTEYQSMEILMKYLTDVSVSPLPRAFVEIEDPLASYVEESMLRNSVSSCIFSFYGVPMSKMNDVKPLLMKTFHDIAEGVIPFDIAVMRDTIHNLILKEESLLETSPHYTFAQYIIHDALYGHTCEDLNKEINQIEWYEHLLSEPTSYWINLLKVYLLDAPSAAVKGYPSVDEAQRLQDEESLRVKQRKERLGDKGLQDLEERVLEADQINEISPPDSMLESIPVPSTSKINFHALQVYSNIANHSSGVIPKSDDSLFDLNAVPVKMQLDDIKSNFVEIVAILDTHSLSPYQRLYIPLLLDLLLESNILKNGEEVYYEDVVKNLNADTLKAEVLNGLYMRTSTFTFGSYFHNVAVNLEVEMGKYEKGVEWIGDILFRVNFNAERVSVKANKLLNSIGDKKREGNTILKLMYNDVVYKNDSNVNKANVLRQEKFLNNVLTTLKTNPEKILQDINNVYKNITNVDNIIIHMSTKFKALAAETNATKPWLNFIPNGHEVSNFNMNIIEDWKQKKPFEYNQNITGYIVGMGSIESAYLLQTTPVITNYTHADLPVLMVAISYLTQLEGPMWKRIRGKGLAYSYLITLKPNEGSLTLRLARAAQLTEAYKEALNIINAYLNGTIAWDRLLFESARSALMYEVIEREAEISDVIQQSIYAYYRKVPHDYNRALLRAIDEVMLDDLHSISLKYFKPMLDPNLSKTVVVCPTSKVSEVERELTKLGHSINRISSLEASMFSELNL